MKYKWIVKNAYINFKLNNLYMLINPSHKIYLKKDMCYCFEIYIKYRIFNNCILVCDMLDNWWKLISSTLHLDKSHIKYNYLSNTFIVSDFELGIKLESNLLTKFNFEFYNGLILNQLSITNGLSLKRENYNKSLKFSNCKFNKEFCIARINISKQIVFENIYFLENVFIEWVNFNENSCLRFFKCNFKKQCNFKYNIFYNEIDFLDIYAKELILEQNIFNKFLYIQNSTINNINLWKNKFKNRCYFMDSVFGNKNNENIKLNFSNAHFEDNAYFNNSEFYSYADFHECEFDDIACFYGVKFYKAPNFSACYFKEPKAVNLINVDIDKLDFKSVEKYIEDNYKDESYKNETKGIQDEKEIFKIQNEYRLRYAKNLKDSFRVIKDVLITQNNTLEAQEWHKLELYAKEKELEIQLGGDNKDSIKNIQKIKKSVIKKPSNNPSNILAKIQSLSDKYIKIYDFAVCFVMVIGKSIFNFLSSIIGILYNITKAICKIIQIILSCMLHITSISRILKFEYLKFYRKISSLGKTMLDFTLWFDCVLLQVYRNTSNHHTNFLKILNFTILMISLYAFMGFVFSKTINFISSFNSVSIIIANYFILFALIMVFFNVKRQLHQQGSILFFGIFGIFIILMMLLLSPVYIPTFCFLIYFASILFFYLLFLCEIKLFVFILRLVAYGCLIVVIILKPQLINPFAGIFSSDKLYESQFEKSLNDLNTSAIINLASILQSDFNLHLKDQNISFAELNSAKALIVANKENLLKLNVANLNIAKEVLGEKYTELLKTINQDEITENTIKSTSVLYSIILLLCIFSLQKTARKNSIVPS
ncbi:TPA: pentapeptide repeat-containing protein [Campylobacter jejuni]|nr:pentapeptide repeat-containing protein [Campylobacter jejuni]HEE9076287.1 pentapeptide repeat-containing protein [Campylobacter jejuni]HEE9096162.1 pentapeptide repeat-containing protein [Campylobacter jejuni]